jgi:hypothetical protein
MMGMREPKQLLMNHLRKTLIVRNGDHYALLITWKDIVLLVFRLKTIWQTDILLTGIWLMGIWPRDIMKTGIWPTGIWVKGILLRVIGLMNNLLTGIWLMDIEGMVI